MSQITTDHQTIRRWAERHGGKPAAVTRTHDEGDVGIIRIMFPDAARSAHERWTEISWEKFFEEFDQRELALVYDDDSLFSKVVSRESAEEKSQSGKAAKANKRSGAQKSSWTACTGRFPGQPESTRGLSSRLSVGRRLTSS